MNRTTLALAVLCIVAIALLVTSSALIADPPSASTSNSQQTSPTETTQQPNSTQQSTPTQNSQTPVIEETQQPNPTQGAVTSTSNIGIYTDPQTTTLCTNLDWGTLNEGTSAIQTLYIKNSGNTIATLHLTTTDWTPVATTSLMTLSWNKEGTTLNPGSVVAATLTLSAAQDMADVDSFDFNIIIQGTA
jgi:hypothetical protein